MAVTATCIDTLSTSSSKSRKTKLWPHQVYRSAILVMTQRISNRHPSFATLGEWVAHYMVIYCRYMSSVSRYRTFSWKPHVWVICWGRHRLPPEQGAVLESRIRFTVSVEAYQAHCQLCCSVSSVSSKKGVSQIYQKDTFTPNKYMLTIKLIVCVSWQTHPFKSLFKPTSKRAPTVLIE